MYFDLRLIPHYIIIWVQFWKSGELKCRLELHMGATSPLKAKVRYEQKARDVGNKINIGIELKVRFCSNQISAQLLVITD